ncbi:TonB-dependent receptor [Emcibacter sp.]|uniref:TonB-dependent receptor n=1 Tax=Emcibacter sp. TaxID=1979954 RepID=UPI002AA65A1F|nr:TonB-dependent receptor [Emcibacter sp.]
MTPFTLHRKKQFRVGMVSLAALMALGSASSATAQEEEMMTLEEIVVTAQFREQNLQDTPLAITAVSGEMMEARSQINIVDVAVQAPSVYFIQAGGAFGPSLGGEIRGVGQFDFNPAYEPGVGIYVDDVYYPILTGSVMDLLDLERVEILRGPQGTLTGRNSIGGAIKMVSRRPTGESQGYVSASYGSRDLIDIRGSADFTLTDNLYARVSGVHKEQKGWVDRVDYGCANPGNPEGIPAFLPSGGGKCTFDKLGGEGYTALRGMVNYAPDEKLNILITADVSNVDRTPAADVVTVSNFNPNMICGPTCSYANYYLPATESSEANILDARSRFKGWGLSANIDYALTDNLQLQSITAYREFNAKWGTDDDSGADPSFGAGGWNDMSHDFFSQEIRLNGQISDGIDFTVGAFYSDQLTTYYTVQDIRYIPGLLLQFQGNDPVNADSFAVFGTVIASVTDDLTITAGVRYTEESKDYTFVRKNFDGTTSFVLGTLDGVTAEYSGDNVDYRVTADYRFAENFMAYATISTGFKGGGVSARPFNATQALEGSFNPEKLINYEVGFKAEPFENSRLNFAVFYNDYTDLQIPISDCSAYGGGPCGVVLNGGDAEFWGVELEFETQPVEGLSINASASYIDTKWTRVDERATSINLTDRVSSTPTWQASFGIQYEADLGENGSITPRFDMTYIDKRFVGRGLGDPGFLPSYTLATARLTWRNADQDLAVSLAVTNLFDEYYKTSQFSALFNFTGGAYDTLGKPREWMLNVKKDF